MFDSLPDTNKMPPDIRGFFGPKRGQSASNSQEKHPIRTPTKPPTPAKESRKRKSVALDDDDDDDEDDVFPAAKTRSSRKSRKIVDDDDEDEFAPDQSPKKVSAKKSRTKPYVLQRVRDLKLSY